MSKNRPNQPLAASLYHQIFFLKVVDDEQEQDRWQEVIATYAEINPLSYNHYSTADSVQFGTLITEAYYTFRIRFIEGIDNNLRIKFHDRLFDIKKVVNPSEKNQILQILALEIKSHE